MCLYTFQKYARKAKKDIYVFKRLSFNIAINSEKAIYTPYRDFKICRNKIAKLSAIEFEKTGLEYHIDYSNPKTNKCYHINYGFHAYKTYGDARWNLQPNEMIVRCKIPAGSYYFQNKTEICSNKIEINVTYCSKDVLSACSSWRNNFMKYFKYTDKISFYGN